MIKLWGTSKIINDDAAVQGIGVVQFVPQLGSSGKFSTRYAAFSHAHWNVTTQSIFTLMEKHLTDEKMQLIIERSSDFMSHPAANGQRSNVLSTLDPLLCLGDDDADGNSSDNEKSCQPEGHHKTVHPPPATQSQAPARSMTSGTSRGALLGVPHTSSSTSRAPSPGTSRAPSTSSSQVPSASNSRAPSASNSRAPSASNSHAPSASNSRVPSASNSRAPSASNSRAPSVVRPPVCPRLKYFYSFTNGFLAFVICSAASASFKTGQTPHPAYQAS